MKYRFVTMLGILVVASSAQADWPQFRGPNGLGISSDKNTPITWSATDNVAWKYQMPGPGGSGPIVVGDKVLVTCYSGYGLDRSEPGDQKLLTRHLVCLDRRSGKLLWKADFPAPLPEVEYGSYQALHGYASSTPISDGKFVWTFFGKDGVYCHDLDGKQQWHKSVGTRTHGWGSGTSPVLYKDTVIINASVESGSLIALDKSTGAEKWTNKSMRASWNTPVLVKTLAGATELAVATQPQMLGIDPDTGKQLWSAETYNWYVCPSITTHAGVLYGLQHSICVAVKAGGRDDVTKSHVVWQKGFGAVVTSPLYYNGHLYWAANGNAFCVNAADGASVYKERLKAGGDFYASPVLADGKLYYVSRSDGAYVIEAGPKFKLLAHNKVDPSTCNAGPAISQSQLFLRSDRFLYCIGK